MGTTLTARAALTTLEESRILGIFEGSEWRDFVYIDDLSQGWKMGAHKALLAAGYELSPGPPSLKGIYDWKLLPARGVEADVREVPPYSPTRSAQMSREAYEDKILRETAYPDKTPRKMRVP